MHMHLATRMVHALLPTPACPAGRPVCPVLLTYQYRHFNPHWGIVCTPLHVYRMLAQASGSDRWLVTRSRACGALMRPFHATECLPAGS